MKDRTDQEEGKAPNARDLARSSAEVFRRQNRRDRKSEPDEPAGLIAESILYAAAGIVSQLGPRQMDPVATQLERIADAAERIADKLEEER